MLAENLAGLGHLHLPHQRQRERLEVAREVFALPLPRHRVPKHLAAARTAPARRLSQNLRLLPKGIQMPPTPGRRVIVTGDPDRPTGRLRAGQLGLAMGRLPHHQNEASGRVRLVLRPGHFPPFSQSQQPFKGLLDNHGGKACSLHTSIPLRPEGNPRRVESKPAGRGLNHCCRNRKNMWLAPTGNVTALPPDVLTGCQCSEARDMPLVSSR
jgi:hypothetical protein